MRLVILGVGHVFQIGPQIEGIILEERPAAVCLELDATRFQALMGAPPGRREIPSDATATYRHLARFQEDMARHMGAPEVGGEMRAAANAARAVAADVALVDENAEDMVDRIRREMSWREKFRFLLEMVQVRFSRKGSARIQKEIAKLEENPDAMVDELAKKFPTIKRVLLDERNERMAQRIRQVVDQKQTAVAVLGDGHVEGVAALLRDLNPVVRRLKEIRAMKPPSGLSWALGPGGSSVSFGFEADAGDVASPGPWP